MSWRWIWTLASAAALAGAAGCAGTAGTARHGHPALAVLPDAGPPADAPRLVRPYFASLHALDGLRRGGDPARVRAYLEWYLARLNYPDRHGLTGTIDDYLIDPAGEESPTGGYDSVDSYAATFLVLLRAYLARTGDRALLERHGERIRDVAWLLLHLQDTDGLVRALPGAGGKYLMDNCEVYGGLKAFNALCEELGWDCHAAYWEAEQRLGDAIREGLYDAEARRFHWAREGEVVHVADWDTYYPDALAQLFPILHGVIDPHGSLARHLWTQFQGRHDPRSGREVSPLQRILIEMTREKVLP